RETTHSSPAGQLLGPTHRPHPTIGVSRRPPLPHRTQWHFPALPLKPRLAIATPSRRQENATRSTAVVAMTIVMIMPAMVLAGRRAAHGDAAGLAELRVFCFHASRHPGHVGNDVGAKPHRIGGARLAGGIAALGGRAVER